MKTISRHNYRRGSEYCTVCGGGYEEKPTNCPGNKMNSAQKKAIAAKKLDFIDNEWVVLLND